MHQSSGLKEIISAAGVFSDVTTSQVMAGKHYNRGVRLQKLVYEAVSRQKLLALGEWLSENGMEDPLTDLDIHEEADKVADVISPLLSKFDGHVSKGSVMGQFWNNYLHSVEALLTVFRAERCADWQMYLDGLVAMLPTFFAY